jgi:hypothetical protein
VFGNSANILENLKRHKLLFVFTKAEEFSNSAEDEAATQNGRSI